MSRRRIERNLKELFDRYSRRAYALAYQITLSDADADDCLQEVFIKALRALRKNDDAPGAGWIFRTATTTALDCIRRRGTYARKVAEARLLAEPAANPGPEEALIESEETRRVAKALETLPEDRRAALVLFHLHGMPHAEIAGILGVSVGKVKVDVYRARRELRDRLREPA